MPSGSSLSCRPAHRPELTKCKNLGWMADLGWCGGWDFSTSLLVHMNDSWDFLAIAPTFAVHSYNLAPYGCYTGWASIIEPVTLVMTLARENPASLSKVAYSDSVRSRPGDSTSIIKSISPTLESGLSEVFRTSPIRIRVPSGLIARLQFLRILIASSSFQL